KNEPGLWFRFIGTTNGSNGSRRATAMAPPMSDSVGATMSSQRISNGGHCPPPPIDLSSSD
ncbi:hypothetical protein U1Q18_039439, partial [Sarracenia purpurea var. burkii]